MSFNFITIWISNKLQSFYVSFLSKTTITLCVRKIKKEKEVWLTIVLVVVAVVGTDMGDFPRIARMG